MNQGLTLIELLVVIAIIAILSSVLFLGKSGEEQKLVLERSTYQLAQNLREAQEMAMGAEEKDCDGTKTYNFGIYFEVASTAYYLFADCNNDKIYNSLNDKLLKEIELEKGVQIQSLLPSSPLSVVFSPPDPICYINGEGWGSEGIVTLSFETNMRQVKINSAGRIEILD